MDPYNPQAFLRLGFLLSAYRERRELEWLRFEHDDLTMLLRMGLVTKETVEPLFKHKQDLRRELRAAYLLEVPQAEEEVWKNYGSMWEKAYGSLTDENVARSVEAVVDALRAARLKNSKQHA